MPATSCSPGPSDGQLTREYVAPALPDAGTVGHPRPMTSAAPLPDPSAGAVDRLPEPPDAPYEGALAFFKVLNRWFMVPAVRAGLGAWVSCPLGGYMVLLRVRGRKSGLVRETPLNYVIDDGSAWVLAGFGPKTEWYRNLLADPEVEVLLPGREPVAAVAAEVLNPAVRARIVPAIARSTIGPSFASGINPIRTTDQEILEVMDWVPLVRLTPVGDALEAGPDDPGGRAWVWRQALATLATLAALRLLTRAAGGLLRALR
jgi:deazaflavin-dependent oxidoreductase (nitroreductase family)